MVFPVCNASKGFVLSPAYIAPLRFLFCSGEGGDQAHGLWAIFTR
jgi:hypothetical protein